MLFVVLKPVRYIDHDEIVEVAEIALFLGDGFEACAQTIGKRPGLLRCFTADEARDLIANSAVAPFEPSGPDNGADDRPDWLLWDKEHERVLLTVRIHTDAATCAAYFGLIDGAEYFPWDIYEKAVVRHLCEAIGCRLTV